MNIKEILNSSWRLKAEKQITSLANLKGLNDYAPYDLALYLLSKNLKDQGQSVQYLEEFTTDPEDKKFVRNRYKEYIEAYEFTSPNEEGDLMDLIYLELRLRQFIRYLQKENKGTKPFFDTEKEIREIFSAKNQLAKKLGISRVDQDSGGGKSFADEWKALKEKAEAFVEENKHDWTWRCSSCGQMHIKEMPHWAFEDGTEKSVVWTEVGIKMVQEGKISLENLAEILHTSPIALRELSKKRGIVV